MIKRTTTPTSRRDTALLGTDQTIYTKVHEYFAKTLIYAFLPLSVANQLPQIPKLTQLFSSPQKAPQAQVLPATGSPLKAKIQATIVSGSASEEEVNEAAKQEEIQSAPIIAVVPTTFTSPEPTPAPTEVPQKEATTSALVEKTNEAIASASPKPETEDAVQDQAAVDSNTQNALKKVNIEESEDATVQKPVSFIWPADGTVSQRFSAYHTGIDIPGSLGTPIHAAEAGAVSAVIKDSYGYGWYIIVDHAQGYQTLYAHLSKFSVATGQKVNQGDLLGLRGSTGRSSGSHVHFEVIKSGLKVNPLTVLK